MCKYKVNVVRERQRREGEKQSYIYIYIYMSSERRGIMNNE